MLNTQQVHFITLTKIIVQQRPHNLPQHNGCRPLLYQNLGYFVGVVDTVTGLGRGGIPQF